MGRVPSDATPLLLLASFLVSAASLVTKLSSFVVKLNALTGNQIATASKIEIKRHKHKTSLSIVSLVENRYMHRQIGAGSNFHPWQSLVSSWLWSSLPANSQVLGWLI
jgi:hypothetical protein